MYFPIPCLRGYLYFATFLTFALGVYSAVVSLTILNNPLLLEETRVINKNLSICLFLLGVILILIGFAGLYGVWNKHASSMIIYQCGGVIYATIFLLIGLAGLLIFRSYSQKFINFEECSENKLFKQLEAYSESARETLCTLQCPCSAEPTLVISPFFQRLKTEPTGVKRVQDCESYKYRNESLMILDFAEKYLGCAGVCVYSPIFLFSNIDNGTPKSTCAEALMEYLETYSTKFGATCMLGSFILLVNLTLAFCLCYHPDRKDERFYKRLADV